MGITDKITRRRFFALTCAATGSLLLLQNCASPRNSWRFFTINEAALMDALADQLIPPDEWPGGKDSGVTNFIDIQLIGPYARFQETYRKGLKAIDEACNLLYKSQFEKLLPEQQMAFLENMEAGKIKITGFENGFDKVFFEMVLDHAMQGYYGSSRHGGNKNNMSYRMLQLDYPLIIGQNRYKT